ncbi:MAG TPA: hypothetical protein VF510_26770 [Ktedonobacterales bacterium]
MTTQERAQRAQRAKQIELVVLATAFVACAAGGWFAHAIWLLDALVFIIAAWSDATNLFTWHRRLTFMSMVAESNLLFFGVLALQMLLFPATFAGYVVTGLQAGHERKRAEQAVRIAVLEAQAGIAPAYTEELCIHCGRVEKFTGPHCPHCGKAQEPERSALKICGRCGGTSYATAVHCSHCGAPLLADGMYQVVGPEL